jgi:PAS domain S-box-containing protein
MSRCNERVVRFPVGIVTLCLFTVALLWAALIFDVKRTGNAAIEQAHHSAENLAMAFRENVNRTMSAIDQLMITVIAQNNAANENRIPAWVKDSALLHGMTVQVALIRPDGIMIESTTGVTDRIDLSDRPHFRYHLDPSAPQPYISAPLIGRASGKWSLQVSRRFTRKDGSFGGVIVVSIDPFYFSRFFEEVDLGQNGVVDLIGRDGIVRARRALGSQEIGQNVGDTALFKRMQDSSAGSDVIRSRLDGIARVYGFSSVLDYPLVVVVGLAMDDVLTATARRWASYLALGGALTFVIVALSWFLARESQRRRQRELAAHAEETIRDQKAVLDTALNNMRHGLLMFDRDSRLVVVNRTYIEMYRLSPQTAKPGCTRRELLQHRAASGTFAGDVDDYIENRAVYGHAVDEIFEIPDGRSIRVVNRIMDDGGWVSTHIDVTARRKAEAALAKACAEAERAEQEARAAHARLCDAFEVVPEGLALFDAEDRFVMWNRRYAELYSRAPNAIQAGMRFEDALRAGFAVGQYPEAEGREEEWLAERLALHALDNSDHECRLPNGSGWLRICERRTADGGSVGIRIDISELKQREESVRMLFEVNPVSMLVVDCDDLKILATNDAAIRHYGYSREQFLAMTKLDIHPAEDRQRYVEVFRAFRESGQAEFEWKITRRHRKADGSDILVHVYGRRLTYQGRPAVLCSIIDVTERVLAEAERDRSREFLNRVIENVPVTIIVKDARTERYTLVNRAGEKLWGLARDEFIGKTPHEIFAKETADIIVDHDRKLLESDSNLLVPEQTIVTPRNGVRLVSANRLAIRDANGEAQYLLAVVEDMTERKGVEDQLRQAQKMEAVGNLTGGVAHDFNNLLTVIIGNLDLLQEDVAGNVSAERRIEAIMHASERGADLTRDMLAFSRRQPLQAKPVDVNALIARAMRLLGRTLGGNILVEVHATDDLAAALVDQAQLETALLNIAINARDAMPGGGTLTISTRMAELDRDYAALHPGVVPGAYVAIEIADSGTGIPPDVLERIFEPFFTTKAVGHGTGLGLSMVYGFIKQSGGHITAYSEIGHGTVFKLFLPLAELAAARTPATQSMMPHAAKPASNEVILAVEDNPDIRATVVFQLRNLGYQVREADSAHAALQILDAAEPVDLLFTDMVMPGGINGKELAIKARAKRADLKVLFTSGFPGTSSGHGAQLEPGDVLLSKPYHKRDLAKAVEEVLSAPA